MHDLLMLHNVRDHGIQEIITLLSDPLLDLYEVVEVDGMTCQPLLHLILSFCSARILEVSLTYEGESQEEQELRRRCYARYETVLGVIVRRSDFDADAQDCSLPPCTAAQKLLSMERCSPEEASKKLLDVQLPPLCDVIVRGEA